MMYWFKRKYKQIRNVIKWLPIIWRQFDFDYIYSIEVFKFQLEKTAKHLESNDSVTLSAKDKAKRIRTVLKLMDRVYEGYYEDEWSENMKKLYGDDVLDFKCEDYDGKSMLLKYKYEDYENADEIEKKNSELFKAAQEKQEKAHRILWALFMRYYLHCWH